VAGDEEGCCTIRISLLDMSEDEGRASETRWDPIALRYTGVEMGQHLDGICDPFATNF